MVAFYSCIVYLFPLLDSWSATIICCVVSELMFLPAMVAILLIGLCVFVYDCALNILYFPLFMYFVMWGFLIGL
jgi:hypothetical protein